MAGKLPKLPRSMVTTNEPTCFRERLREATQQIESRLIREALERNRWNRKRTAQSLQISYRSLMYKMKRCNIREEAALDLAEAQ